MFECGILCNVAMMQMKGLCPMNGEKMIWKKKVKLNSRSKKICCDDDDVILSIYREAYLQYGIRIAYSADFFSLPYRVKKLRTERRLLENIFSLGIRYYLS